ncbi:dihydrodipicolinate synthase family protein [Microlunatus endophyticus]|uniref:Dihydrodipicolinate synthase family protein n=1 Tax=Microlunatus endophyticus TaxID=1716077 RepID=A0A917W3E3_9ACTN|nr:dihydrodipicolinate synthase family protein [Microlunatus endophyticus]GGL59083.1 dihydrodipicolinate synthase family protein [Microlunatus endophyticus]
MNKPDLGGVVVATALPYREDASAPAGLAVDHDRYAEHCDWLITNGCRGVGPNGSLGEYSSLTDDERRQVVKTAVAAASGHGIVIAGVHAPGSHLARHWAELAGEDGADAVLCLPPTMYRATPSQVVDHFAEVASVGLPVMIYNNPIDTKVDLTPELVAEIATIDNVVAIKEFSGDVRRPFEISELCDIDVIAGADDLLFELLVDGAVGWFAGFPNAFPSESVELYNLVRASRIDEARELYRHLVPVFRWDSRTEFVQAIKLGMDMVGRYGGPCRPPRGPLTAEHEAQIRSEMEHAIKVLSERTPTDLKPN